MYIIYICVCIDICIYLYIYIYVYNIYISYIYIYVDDFITQLPQYYAVHYSVALVIMATFI